MAKASREFQIFSKPVGAVCNLDCRYCYYLEKERLYPENVSLRMPDDLLETYIVQHIEAAPGKAINFSWHGGEPTILGLRYFRRIVELQRRHAPSGRRITNGIQTNGLLLDEDWCRFLAAEEFTVGLSLDGPREFHDEYRVTKGGKGTHEQVLHGYELLKRHRIPVDILCVVHALNVSHPLRVYRFFKELDARYIGLLPLVERESDAESGVSSRTATAEALGDFLCAIFDEWKSRDIGKIMVQTFEEVAQTALGQEHALCIFRKTCGDIPVVEHNGDFYACDHFVDNEHRLGNILETPLAELLERPAQKAFGQAKRDALPRYCLECEVLDMCGGGCPKDRLIQTPDGEDGLNYLCSGYKKFFKHSRPFADALTEQARRQREGTKPGAPTGNRPPAGKPGRNDPCPCGSGRKYKKCCIGK
ncbi:MAG: anaerobic sulfatase maturase [Proteobacteria bacterium]|nr:anaerobic sulfatase maturase [Pseudomonadota bacterium]